MRIPSLVLLLAATLSAQPGSFEGTVVNQANGQALAGVHVRLFEGYSVDMATLAYGAMSDDKGHFSVAIPAGTFNVQLERTGFLQVPGDVGISRNTEIALRPGEHVAGRRLEMLPLVPIAGRVVNRRGDPVPGAQVRAASGAAEMRPGASPPGFSNKSADERGQFRLFVTPGKYYILATPPLNPV